jgi:hypothetical protein
LFVLLSCVVRTKNIVEDLVWMTLVWSCVLSIFVYFEKRHRIRLLLFFFCSIYMYAYRYQLWMNEKKINWHRFRSFHIIFFLFNSFSYYVDVSFHPFFLLSLLFFLGITIMSDKYIHIRICIYIRKFEG